MSKTVYISGRVSDGGTLPAEEVEANMRRFDIAAAMLREKGVIPINPTRHGVGAWTAMMRFCLVDVAAADGIYVIPGTRNRPSRGRSIELLLAEILEIPEVTLGADGQLVWASPGASFAEPTGDQLVQMAREIRAIADGRLAASGLGDVRYAVLLSSGAIGGDRVVGSFQGYADDIEAVVPGAPAQRDTALRIVQELLVHARQAAAAGGYLLEIDPVVHDRSTSPRELN